MSLQNGNIDAQTIAEWMTEQVRYDPLPQSYAASSICEMFGDEWLTETETGHWGIKTEVRELFRQMNPDVIWDRRNRAWRKKDEWDD